MDLNGDVVGINSSIRTASSGGLDSSSGGSIGLGFAIPIDQVWPVVQQLRNGETPTHARLGVSVTDASSNGGLLNGAGIESVNPGSAAEKAGLKRGDVVTKVDDEIITGSDSLVATIRGHRPGDKVTLTVVDGGTPAPSTSLSTATGAPPPADADLAHLVVLDPRLGASGWGSPTRCAKSACETSPDAPSQRRLGQPVTSVGSWPCARARHSAGVQVAYCCSLVSMSCTHGSLR